MNLEITKFDNLLDKISFTYNQAKENIIDIHYVSNRYTLPRVELDDSLPFFVDTFYKCVIKYNLIPDQIDFWTLYLQDNSEYFYKKYIDNNDRMALQGRIARAYPSLVREFLCILQTKEIFSNYKVIYNIGLDVKEGIDILMINNNINYGVNLYTNTENSLDSKSKKMYRHTIYDNINYIDLPFDMKNISLQIGDFYLYSEYDMNNLKALINNHQDRNQNPVQDIYIHHR